MKSNYRTKLTDVGFEEGMILTSPLIVVLHHVTEVSVVSSSKYSLPQFTIGLVNIFIRMVEGWPPKNLHCGFQCIIVFDGFIH